MATTMNGSAAPGPPDDAPLEPRREKRALIAALVLVVAVGSICIRASLQPVQTPAFYGARILTPLQVFNTLEKHFSGPGCGAYLAGMQTNIDEQYAEVTIPMLGAFEVHSHHFPSGLFTVRATGPVLDRPDCRFNPRYQGPAI